MHLLRATFSIRFSFSSWALNAEKRVFWAKNNTTKFIKWELKFQLAAKPPVVFFIIMGDYVLSQIMHHPGYFVAADILRRHHWFPCEMTAENPYWWRGSTSNWLKQIFHAAWPIRTTTYIWVVTRNLDGISMLVSQTSFPGETNLLVASQNVSCFLRLVLFYNEGELEGYN